MITHAKKKLFLALVLIFSFSITITGCSDSGNGVDIAVFDSAEIKAVKNGTLGVCPSATVGQMADSFLSNPKWRDFTSTSGDKVVELTGGFSYDGKPVTALIQFPFDGLSFEAAYLGINGIDQSILVLSALLRKMCSAT
jgi:hypothetical protein